MKMKKLLFKFAHILLMVHQVFGGKFINFQPILNKLNDINSKDCKVYAADGSVSSYDANDFTKIKDIKNALSSDGDKITLEYYVLGRREANVLFSPKTNAEWDERQGYAVLIDEYGSNLRIRKYDNGEFTNIFHKENTNLLTMENVFKIRIDITREIDAGISFEVHVDDKYAAYAVDVKPNISFNDLKYVAFFTEANIANYYFFNCKNRN